MATPFSPGGQQFQRKANLLEQMLDVLQIPSQTMAGLTSSVINRKNPIKEVGYYLKRDKSFIDLLQDQGVNNTAAIGAGLALDIFADPTTYLTFGGKTAAGLAARGASLALNEATAAGDVAKFITAGEKVAKTGVYGAKLSEQAARKQRALISFANKPVVYGEGVFKAGETVGEFVANSRVGKSIGSFLGTTAAKAPEWARLRMIQRTGAIGKADEALGKELAEQAKEFYKLMDDIGVDSETARDMLRESVELSKPKASIDLTEFMDERTRQKYVRWVWQAEAYKRGLPHQMRVDVHGNIKHQFGGRRRRPNTGQVGMQTPGSNVQETLDANAAIEAVRGRKLRGRDRILASEATVSEAGERSAVVVKQGAGGADAARLAKLENKTLQVELNRLLRKNSGTPDELKRIDELQKAIAQNRKIAAEASLGGKVFDDNGLQIPNLFGLSDSWDFAGRMPDELMEGFRARGEMNTVEAIRRAERAAMAQYTSLRTASVIKQVIKKYGWQTKETGLNPTLQKFVNYINASNAAYLANESRTGLRITELTSDFNYLHRAFTPEARAAYMEANASSLRGGGSAYDVSVKFGAQVRRSEEFNKLTVTEINELGLQGKLTDLFGNRKVKVFEDDPFWSTFRRGTQSNAAIESAKLVQDNLAVFGRQISGTLDKPITTEMLQPGERFLSDRIAAELGIRKIENGRVVGDVALPEDIVNLLNSHYERVFAPQEMQPVLRAFDTITRMWKNITLPIWPAYQTRNLLSDIMMITHNADDYGLTTVNAVRAMKTVTMGMADSARGKAGKLIDIGGGQKVQWSEFKSMLDQYGVLDYSAGRDLDDLVMAPRGLSNKRPGLEGLEQKMTSLAPFQFGMAAGQARQNMVNSSYFLGLLRMGVTPEVAALEVKKKLFDFRNLTSQEKQIMRRIFPFYSWLRHNLPYQLKAVAKRPKILTEIQHAREAATGGEGPAGDVPLPSFLAQGLPIASPFQSAEAQDKPSFMRLKGLLPVSDVLTVLNPGQEIMNSMSPLLKTPFEIARNIDTFQNTPLERYPGEATKVLGVPVSRRYIAPLARNVRPISEVDNLLNPERTLESKLAGLALAKGYDVDVAKQRSFMYFRVKQEEVRIKKLMYQAMERGNPGEVVTLRKYLLSLYDNPHQLLR